MIVDLDVPPIEGVSNNLVRMQSETSRAGEKAFDSSTNLYAAGGDWVTSECLSLNLTHSSELFVSEVSASLADAHTMMIRARNRRRRRHTDAASRPHAAQTEPSAALSCLLSELPHRRANQSARHLPPQKSSASPSGHACGPASGCEMAAAGDDDDGVPSDEDSKLKPVGGCLRAV